MRLRYRFGSNESSTRPIPKKSPGRAVAVGARRRPLCGRPVQNEDPGDVLLSHQAALAVPSALEGLTAVFGMGTGVAPPP